MNLGGDTQQQKQFAVILIESHGIIDLNLNPTDGCVLESH